MDPNDPNQIASAASTVVRYAINKAQPIAYNPYYKYEDTKKPQYAYQLTNPTNYMIEEWDPTT